MAVLSSLVIRINPLIEGGIDELALNPNPQLKLFLFCFPEIFAEDSQGLEGFSELFDPVVLVS